MLHFSRFLTYLLRHTIFIILLVVISTISVNFRVKDRIFLVPIRILFSLTNIFIYTHGCQSPDLDLTILRFFDSTYSKRLRSFKDLSDHSRSVGSYDFNDPKQLWFLIIFFNLTEGLVGPK